MRLNRFIPVFELFVVAALLWLPAATQGQDQNNFFTLGDSIKEATSKSWKLRSGEEKIEQAHYGRKQARAGLFPKVGTTYGYTRLSEVPTFTLDPSPGRGTEVPTGTLDNYRWTGFVTQPLFTGFALVSSFRLAELGIDQSKLELELEKLNLVLNVKEGI